MTKGAAPPDLVYSASPMRPMLIINVAALSPRELGGHMPQLGALGERGSAGPMRAAFPMLTCSSHATMMTGSPPAQHGIVGNGWYDRDYARVFMWNRSDHLVAGEKLWEAARTRDASFTCANLLWRFGADSRCDTIVAERPTYWASGRKTFDFYSAPSALHDRLVAKLGSFPFPQFWGPLADIKSTRWILDATLEVMRVQSPTLVMAYAPYLDYEAQRHGPDSPQARAALTKLDAALEPLLTEARQQGRDVAIVSDYGFTTVDNPVFPNRALRRAGLLNVEQAANGEQLEPGSSRAFAVCDNQIAHVYVASPDDITEVRGVLEALPGVAEVLGDEGMRSRGIAHRRAGELIAVADSRSWFAYPHWLDDAQAPDFARCIAIFDKGGFDPCELFARPGPLGKPYMGMRVAQKLARLAVPFDVIDPDARRPRGARNVSPGDDGQATLITSWSREAAATPLPMEDLKQLLLHRMFDA